MEILPFLCLTVFIVGIVAVVYVFITRSMEFVTEGNIAVVERSGKYRDVLSAGRHFLPPTDRIRATVGLQEYSETIPADAVITQDATIFGLDMDISYRIARLPKDAADPPIDKFIRWKGGRILKRDVINAVYNVDNWQERTKQEATTFMFDFFSMVDLERDIFGNDGAAINRIASSIRDEVNEKTLKFGVEITRVKLYNIFVDEATRMALTTKKRAKLQNDLRLRQAEYQRQIRDTLHLNNTELLRWWEIEANKSGSLGDIHSGTGGGGGGGGDERQTGRRPNTGPFAPNSGAASPPPPNGGGNKG